MYKHVFASQVRLPPCLLVQNAYKLHKPYMYLASDLYCKYMYIPSGVYEMGIKQQ